MLYGSFAEDKAKVPTKAFGDIATLESKELLSKDGDTWRIRFAHRDGSPPKVSFSRNREDQWREVVERLRWLTDEQQVRPEDILVLAYYKNQVEQLANALNSARLTSIQGIHVATSKKDDLIHRRGWLTISTVASAKGYDAYCVLLAGANEFPVDVQGRASFYVACTRAIEYLEVFSFRREGLAMEMERAVQALE